VLTEIKPANSMSVFDLSSAGAATTHIREMNERLMESSKSAGNVTLDAYEKAFKTLVDFEEKVSSTSQLEWVSALASTHAKFVAAISASYTEAARQLLK
jgi:hypothetical protein